MPQKSPLPQKDQVLREYPPMGKYRVRLVTAGQGKGPRLDIREYISSETFEGFTRRGISIAARAEMALLGDVLKEILASNIVFKSDVPPKA